MKHFTHIDEKGHARMVDITEKAVTDRFARAKSVIRMSFDTIERIRTNRIIKGNVLETARIAGILAAKQTALLIPMCHPLNITHVAIDFDTEKVPSAVEINATIRVKGPTGAEMEALVAASTAALTIYDMCKSHDREMVIEQTYLLEKSGGKSGHYVRSDL